MSQEKLAELAGVHRTYTLDGSSAGRAGSRWRP
jgi:hypothetical protein